MSRRLFLRARPHTQRPDFVLEPMEQRRLLVATLSPEGLLSVVGTGSADNIELTISGADLTVDEDGSPTLFAAADVLAISIDAGGGDDRVVLSNAIIGATIRGGDGDDKLFGGGGDDVLIGGAGADELDGGLGIDTADYSERSADLTLVIGGGNVSGAAGEGDDIHSDIENVTAGSGDDTLTGNGADNILEGGAGNDTINGGGGDDILRGGSGNDQITGGSGSDILAGNDGDDIFFAADGNNDALNGGSGTDTAQSYDLGLDTRNSVELPAPEITVFRGSETFVSGAGTFDFGSTVLGGTGAARTFSVRNDGDEALTLSNLGVPAGYTITDNLPASLAAGQTTTFTVRLDADALGEWSGQLSFDNNDADENPFVINITGTVVPPPAPEIKIEVGTTLLVDGTSLVDFGSVTRAVSTRNKIFTVTNTGTADLTLGTLTIPKGFTLLEGLVATLEPGQSDSFTVRLNNYSAGDRLGTLSLANNDSNENPFDFQLKGHVKAPEISVERGTTKIADGTATSISFGTVNQGASAPARTFTIRNTGDAALTVGKPTVPAGFKLSTAPPTSVAAGGSATFTVKLLTSSTGLKKGTVKFSNNDADENPYTFPIWGKVVGVSVVRDSAGVLTVTGTVNADRIVLSGGSTVQVSANGRSLGSFSSVRRVVVNAGGGNDQVLAGALTIPSQLNGGDGNDTLTGGDGNDTLRGGAGNDTLTGGYGVDSLYGDAGDDILNGVDGTPDAVLDGGAGNDTVRGDPTDSKSGT